MHSDIRSLQNCISSFPSSFEASSGSAPVAGIINIIKPHSFASTLSTVTQSSSIQNSSAPFTKKAEPPPLDKSSESHVLRKQGQIATEIQRCLEPNHCDSDMMIFSKLCYDHLGLDIDQEINLAPSRRSHSRIFPTFNFPISEVNHQPPFVRSVDLETKSTDCVFQCLLFNALVDCVTNFVNLTT